MKKKISVDIIKTVPKHHCLPKDRVEFLKSFKTIQCPTEAFECHDHRLCPYFHSSGKDRRRDPFQTFYNVAQAKNNVERLYHPVKYKTTLCINNPQCKFKEFCPNAHSHKELCNKELAEDMYAMKMFGNNSSKKQVQLKDFFSQGRRETPKSKDISYYWNDIRDPMTNKNKSSEERILLKQNSSEWFMIHSSESFRNYLREVAFEEGLCRIEIIRKSWGENHDPTLIVKGMDVENVLSKIKRTFQNPPQDFFDTQEKPYISDRIRDKLKHVLAQNRNMLVPEQFDKYVYIKISDSSVKAMFSKNREYHSTKMALDSIFDRIDFWIKQEGYDNFYECCCCFNACRNIDQGVKCKCGCFICAVENCLVSFVETSIPEIHEGKGRILCPMCKDKLDIQLIAQQLPPEKWELLHEAIVDSEVKSEYERLQSDFDRRLQDKVEELMAEYACGNVENLTKEKAKLNAARARNVALNLKCPHCDTVYFDFEGCMALKCSTCMKCFCGYCHIGFESSQGTHQHVRACLMNETRNGSYYANANEVKVAQRRYRTRELKKFLQKFKKEEQNATIIELQDDLKDLDIDPASLFEFGSDLRAMEQF